MRQSSIAEFRLASAARTLDYKVRTVQALPLVSGRSIVHTTYRLGTMQRGSIVLSRETWRPASDAASGGAGMRALSIDDYEVEEFASLAAQLPPDRYGYVVTPNVDHLIRYGVDERLRILYAAAAFVLLDSCFLARCLTLMRRQRLRVCRGSDLTLRLLQQVSSSHERIVLVGATAAQARQLSACFKLHDLVHVDVPMGFIGRPEQLERCLADIEAAAPFRYCFLAVGSPQQEEVAYRLQQRGRARGLALCVGASINFLTGVERRAPLWMQRWGLEWLFRLLQNPRRLAKRYLLRGPRIFWQLPRLQFMPRRRSIVGAGVGLRGSLATMARAQDTSGMSARGLVRG
ncbi:MAG TPA: WecB/TagA/CpsF family glycosyltransferase [Steroidobacteraceae bacterium]|jgi:exopolysaccharide biosynthesis WecB/TagA/CpsF family protein|nr:WecB/TagA/CpsF family glycosyltransferase [Steroidobacteraceae bacterium]